MIKELNSREAAVDTLQWIQDQHKNVIEKFQAHPQVIKLKPKYRMESEREAN